MHQIFISHSGEQKPFAEFLYYELDRANHKRVFFDQDTTDSLPKGSELQQTILGAVKRCELGVVIISEAFIISRWPMLELQHLVAAIQRPSKPASAKKIYPIFFGLEPSDLTKPENLARWQAEWDKMVAPKNSNIPEAEEEPISGNFNISAWPKALQELRSRAGTTDVKVHPGHWRKSVDTIIREICHILPPPLFYSEPYVKGKEGTIRVIEDRFSKILQHSNGSKATMVLGVYGIGGAGKTTLCRTTVDFYNGHQFCGKSWCLELPTDEDNQKFTQEVKKATIALTGAREESIKHIDNLQMAISTFKGRMNDCQFFLAIDNVWEWSIPHVLDILKGVTRKSEQYTKNNKIIITSRSEVLLNSLLKNLDHSLQGSWGVDHVPNIIKEDALRALKEYVGCAWLNDANHKEEFERDLNDIVNLCFFRDRCHPLLLKAMGNVLGKVQDWHMWKVNVGQIKGRGECLQENITHNRVSDEEIDDILVNTLELNYNALGKSLQMFFMDFAFLRETLGNNFKTTLIKLWHLNGLETFDEMEAQMSKLERAGLWRVRRSYQSGKSHKITDVEIHDLYTLLARKKARDSGRYLFVGGFHDIRPSSGEGKLVTRVMVEGWYTFRRPSSDDAGLQQIFSSIFYNKIEFLEIDVDIYASLLEAARNHFEQESIPIIRSGDLLQLTGCVGKALRILRVYIPEGINVIRGLSRATDLRYLEFLSDLLTLADCLTLAERHLLADRHLFVEGIQCLTKLHYLLCENFKILVIPNLSGCLGFRRLSFCSKQLNSLRQLHLSSQMLEVLHLNSNNLVALDPNVTLRYLKTLHLNDCSRLKTLGLSGCSQLKTLRLTACSRLKTLGLSGCSQLKTIDLRYCSQLKTLDLNTHCSRLETLDLRGCSQLKILNLSDCSQLKTLDVSGCSQLETLDLKGCSQLEAVMPDCATSLSGQLPALEELNLYRCEGLKSFPALGRNSRLRILEAPIQFLHLLCNQSNIYADSVVGQDLEIIKVHDKQEYDSNLKELTIQVSSPCSLNFLFTCSFPNLTSLDLEGFSSVEELKLSTLSTTFVSLKLQNFQALQILELDSSSLPNLEYLRMENCNSLKTLPDLPSSIRKLEISHGCSISLENLQQSLLPLKKLTSLTYHASRSASTDLREGFKLDLSCQKDTLTHLCLTNCAPLDMSCLLNLESLRLFSCSSLESLDGIAGLTRLSKITLLDCSSLKSLPSLAHLTNLTELTLLKCSSLQEIPDLSSNTGLLRF